MFTALSIELSVNKVHSFPLHTLSSFLLFFSERRPHRRNRRCRSALRPLGREVARRRWRRPPLGRPPSRMRSGGSTLCGAAVVKRKRRRLRMWPRKANEKERIDIGLGHWMDGEGEEEGMVVVWMAGDWLNLFICNPSASLTNLYISLFVCFFFCFGWPSYNYL